MSEIDLVHDAINSGKEWFLNSGIQNKDGSFNAWYDEEKMKYSFVYPEITGYAITELLYLNKICHDEMFVENSKKAVNWLIKKAYNTGGFVSKYHNGIFTKEIYSFDTAMCLNGIVNFYRHTHNKNYLEISKIIGNWLINIMQNKNGSFEARYDLEKKSIMDDEDHWSAHPGTFHMKNAIGLLNLYEVSARNLLYKDSVLNLYKWCLDKDEDGRYPTNANDTYMHPQCYTMEGLLIKSLFEDNKEPWKRVEKSLEWILSNKLNTNGIPFNYCDGEFSEGEHVDSLSQAIRIAIILGKDVNDMVQRLLTFQCLSDDPKASGGFYYGIQENGQLIRHVNAHATMFALQALTMWKYRKEFFVGDTWNIIDYFDLV